MKVLFGPAGTSGLGYEKGLLHCKELNLRCLECAFTYGVRMTNAEAKKTLLYIGMKLDSMVETHGKN